MRRISLYLTCVLTLNAQTRVDLKSQAKSVDFTEAQSTRPIKTGVALPATCVTGDMYLMTSAPAGRNLYACTATNLWSMQAPPELPEMTEQANKVLVHDGTGLSWQRVGGDVTGNIGALSVTRLRGNPVSSISPSEGQALVWDAVAGEWVPRDIAQEGGSGQALYCSASGTSSAYSCVMNPQLTTYTTGITIHFRAHTASAAGATLDIDGLGAKMLLRSDGSAPAAGEFLSGGHYLLLYDGTAFRASGMLPAPPVNTSLDGMVPTRSSNTVLSVSAGGWRPGGLPGVNTFAGGDITITNSTAGVALFCLGTDQAYIGSTTGMTLSVPAGTSNLGTGVTACPDGTIEWFRWPADDTGGQWDTTQGAGNDKRSTAATPPPCVSSDTVTATRNSDGGCEYSTVPYDIFDQSQLLIVEEFGTGVNTGTTGNIGQNAWNFSQQSGTMTGGIVNGEADHPGINVLTTGSADDNGGCLAPGPSSGTNFLANATASGNWRWQVIVKTPVDATNSRVLVGIVPLNGTSYGTSGGLSALSALSRMSAEYDTGEGDTLWRFRTGNGSSLTTGTSTVSVANGTWYRINVESTVAGTVSFKVNDEPAVHLAGTIPTIGAGSPVVCVWANTAETRQIRIDRAVFRMTGLTR